MSKLLARASLFTPPGLLSWAVLFGLLGGGSGLLAGCAMGVGEDGEGADEQHLDVNGQILGTGQFTKVGTGTTSAVITTSTFPNRPTDPNPSPWRDGTAVDTPGQGTTISGAISGTTSTTGADPQGGWTTCDPKLTPCDPNPSPWSPNVKGCCPVRQGATR